MKIKIRLVFSRVLLAFGPVFIFLVSMPNGAAASADLNTIVPEVGPLPLSHYVAQIDKIPEDRGVDWYYNRVSVNGGKLKLTRSKKPQYDVTEAIEIDLGTGEFRIKRQEGWSHSEVYEGNRFKINSLHKVEETYVNYAGDYYERKITYNPDGTKATETMSDGKGRVFSQVVYLPGGQIVIVQLDPETGKRKSMNVKNKDGSSTTTIFGPDGKTAYYVTNCDKNDICKTEYKGGLASGMKQRQALDRLDPLGSNNVIDNVARPLEDYTRTNDRLRTDVLRQTETNPLGDLVGVKERVKTEGLGRSKVGSLELGPLQAKPKAEKPTGLKERAGTNGADRVTKTGDAPININSDSILSTPPVHRPGGRPPIKDTTNLDNPSGLKERVGSGAGARIKKTRDVPVGINSDRFPSAGATTKLGGSPAIKDTTKFESPSLGRKEQFRGTQRSQSIDRSVQNVDPSRKKIQTDLAQPFKGAATIPDFRKPAGTSGAYPGLR